MSGRDLVPPHNDEAEQAVLGALLMTSGAALNDVPAELVGAHFYRAQYGQVFDAIRRMVGDGRPADVITVAAECAVDVLTLSDLVSSILSARNVAHYAQIVLDRWTERQLLQASSETLDDAIAPAGTPAEKLDRAQARLARIGIKGAKQESVFVHAACLAFMDRLMAEAEGTTEVISTGLRDLDELLNGGLRRGELIVIGARPKMGKTALTLQIARNVAHARHVLVCSQEMPVYELTARNVAALGSLNLGEMRRPERMGDDGWGRVSEAVERMNSLLLTMDEQRALTLLDVRRKVMECKRQRGCDVVIVDYLQLMAGDGDNRNQELDRISNGLKAMAGEFDCAVIVLSQLSREADKRHGPPVMTDLRDSGAIEAAADIIGLLYREYAHPLGEKTEDFKRYAQLEVVQRNGAPGTVPLFFHGEHQQFKDWSGPPPSRTRAGSGSRGGRRTDME